MSDHDNHEDHEDHGEEQNPGLVKKNRQLLSEAKQSRARADELQAQLDAANSELTAIKLTNPVNDMLSDLVHPALSESARLATVGEFIDFALRDNGSIGVFKKDGSEAGVEFSVTELREYLSKVSGGRLDSLLLAPESRGTGMHGNGGYRSNVPKQPAPAILSNRLGIK